MTTTLYTKTYKTGAVLTVAYSMTITARHGVNVSLAGKTIVEAMTYAIDGKPAMMTSARVNGMPEIVGVVAGKYAVTQAEMDTIKAARSAAYAAYLASDECAEVRETNALIADADAAERKYIAERNSIANRMAHGDR